MPKLKDELRSTVASLFDMLTRSKVYAEGVKHWAAQQFAPVIAKLVAGLKRLFDLDVDSVADLTKAQFGALLKRLRDLNTLVFSGHAADTIRLLRGFSQIELNLTRDLYELSTDKTVVRALDEGVGAPILKKLTLDAAWKDALATPMPATGTSMQSAITGFAGSAAKQLSDAVTKARANVDSVSEMSKAIIGTKTATFRDGLLNRLWNQNAAVVNTTLQHVSSRAQAIVGSIFYDRYQWVSVLDGNTTEICRSRAGNIYRYGEGPLPPAHINCRSHIVSLEGKGGTSSPTYYSWLHSQPADFQDDVLGEADAKRLRAGSLKASKFPLLGEVKSLAPEDFAAKFKLMTQGTDEDA